MNNPKSFEQLRQEYEQSKAEFAELTAVLESLHPNQLLEADPSCLAAIDAACTVEPAAGVPITRPMTGLRARRQGITSCAFVGSPG